MSPPNPKNSKSAFKNRFSNKIRQNIFNLSLTICNYSSTNHFMSTYLKYAKKSTNYERLAFPQKNHHNIFNIGYLPKQKKERFFRSQLASTQR